MKALVLAGGSGSRLRPITHTSAKQLLPVANKPVLFYGLEALRDAGITEAGIVVGDTASAVRELTPSWRGELEITEAIQWLIDHGREVLSTTITGYWKDTGNVAGMLEVNRLVLEGTGSRVEGPVDTASELIGRVVVEAGAGVTASGIVGPVIVGIGSRVSGSYAGPFTSVARDCAIAESEIEYSIVLAGASIRGVRRIEASLIGRDVEVTPSPRVPKAHRLVLGDHSKVQISS